MKTISAEQKKEIIDSKEYKIESDTFCPTCFDFTDKTLIPTGEILHILCHQCLTDNPDIIIKENNDTIHLPFQFYPVYHDDKRIEKLLDDNPLPEPKEEPETPEKPVKTEKDVETDRLTD